VGCGLGGLALAHRLSAGGEHEVTVLERDHDALAREQGIAIGLQQGGIDVLTRLRLSPDEILRAVTEPGAVRDLAMMDTSGRVLVRGAGWLTVQTEDGTPHSAIVSRGRLRQHLAETLPETIVLRWGAHVVACNEDPTGVTAVLADGSTVAGDVLVAADGDRSKVRAAVAPHLTPTPLGVFNVAGRVPLLGPIDAPGRNALVAEASRSLVRISAPRGVSLLAFVYAWSPGAANEEQTLLWALSLPTADATVAGLRGEDAAAVLRNAATLIRETFADPADAADVVARTPADGLMPGYEVTSVQVDALEPGLLCEGVRAGSRVTLLGDAAHKTSTHTGMGATAALRDAEELGACLCTMGADVDVVSLRQYEVAMLGRAKAVVAEATGRTAQLHTVWSSRALAAIGLVMWTVGWVVTAVDATRSLFRS